MGHQAYWIRFDLLKHLQKESKELKDISTSFRRVNPDLKIVSFVEEKVMPISNGLVRLVFPEMIVIYANGTARAGCR